MENKISCFGHKNGPSVRTGSDSAPSCLPHLWFGLAAGEGRPARGRQGRGLRSLVHPRRGCLCCSNPHDAAQRGPGAALTGAVPSPALGHPRVRGGTACSSLCCGCLTCPPKLWLGLVAFPGGGGACAIFVSVLLPVTKASSNAGDMVPT